MERVSREERLPLSYAQQRLWFLDQLQPGSPLYNCAAAIRLTGSLDINVLERTLQELIDRHEILRTTFPSVDGKPSQLISACLPFKLPVIDLTELPEFVRRSTAHRLSKQEALSPFNLSQGPLLRSVVIVIDNQDHVVLFTMHHIISDGWSMGILINDVKALYEAFISDEPSPLSNLPFQYADFAHWQRQWLQGENLQSHLSYWKQQLDGCATLQLPTDRPRPPVMTFNGSRQSLVINKQLADRLRALSRQEGATLFMTYLAAFNILLNRYSGQDDISIGTPVANRSRGEFEKLIGFFVNTLVLRTDLSGAPAFRELLARVREMALGAYAHQDLPFEKLVEELHPERDTSRTPLFQIMFVFQAGSEQALQLPGLKVSPLWADATMRDSSEPTARFDLTLSIVEANGPMVGSIQYNVDLFDDETIARMLRHYQAILESLVANPDDRISDLAILTAGEERQLLYDWNDTYTEFESDDCIHNLFEAQVLRTPDADALIFNGRALTYEQLNSKANQLAHHLYKFGVGPETIVAIYTNRSIEAIIAVLGVLKAGAAYLPLDPALPRHRLAFMLEQAEVSVILTQTDLARRMPETDLNLICLDNWETISAEPEYNPNNNVCLDNLAYVIFTSGSTGTPNGVLVTHRGIGNLAFAQIEAFDVQPGSRVLQFSSPGFDASVSEIFMALLSGSSLCLASQESLLPGPGLVGLLTGHSINVVTLPPSVLAVLPDVELPDLRTIITAGEACTAELVRRWADGRLFVNAYGPTEATVCASIGRCLTGDQSPSIGKPMANVRLFILDGNHQPTPVGVPGELHIGGVGLARGYLHRPELTACRFIPNPFGIEEGSRLYKTGDLACYNSDGSIKFLGRIDHQVKIRGFRIELEEIEATLSQHPAVEDAVIVAREDNPGEKRLAAYFVSRSREALSVAELRGFLREKLPEYMVPSAFVQMDALPLTSNGKVDRRALPAPDNVRPTLDTAYLLPRNEAERVIARIWQDALQVDEVGVYDNFFDLGGHSLLLVEVHSRMQQAFAKDFPIVKLFAHPTIESLATHLAEEENTGEQKSKAPDQANNMIEGRSRQTRRRNQRLQSEKSGRGNDR